MPRRKVVREKEEERVSDTEWKKRGGEGEGWKKGEKCERKCLKERHTNNT